MPCISECMNHRSVSIVANSRLMPPFATRGVPYSSCDWEGRCRRILDTVSREFISKISFSITWRCGWLWCYHAKSLPTISFSLGSTVLCAVHASNFAILLPRPASKWSQQIHMKRTIMSLESGRILLVYGAACGGSFWTVMLSSLVGYAANLFCLSEDIAGANVQHFCILFW